MSVHSLKGRATLATQTTATDYNKVNPSEIVLEHEGNIDYPKLGVSGVNIASGVKQFTR